MRTYGKNYKEHPSTVKRTSYADYKNREATEWDVRLDVVNGLTSGKILEHAVAHKDKIKYCFIGGEERPDDIKSLMPQNRAVKPGSEEIHVHVAIILIKPCKRADVLQLLRGPRSFGAGSEYCVPRNPKFTYAGWIMHHSKLDFKLLPEHAKLYEYGDLPMDSYDEDTCWKVLRMLKKFGNPDMKERFRSYSNKIDEYKLAKSIKELDDLQPTVDVEDVKPPAFHPDWNPPFDVVDPAAFAAARKQAQM